MADATSAVVGLVPVVMAVGIADKTMKMTFPKAKVSKRRR